MLEGLQELGWIGSTAVFLCSNVLFCTARAANDPETANDPQTGLQMIPVTKRGMASEFQ